MTVRACFLTVGLVCAQLAHAEPWLSTRSAQNCAGCHAPGRKNTKPIDRRCSLSCQGCHVNPNGGGLRSYYGKWNENRWLRSVRSDLLRHPLKTAPLQSQQYYRAAGGRNGKKKNNRRAAERVSAKVAKVGLPLVETPFENVDEAKYDKYADKNYEIMSRGKDDWLATIPQNDPYRQMEESKIDGGGDIRFATLKYLTGDDKKLKPFLMNADFGLRYRPFYRRLHLVYEARFMGTPQGHSLDYLPNTEQTRSLYMMVDDLPYNVFVMGGYYRPLFGNYVPDHTALASRMISQMQQYTSSSYNAVYKAASIGTAPNVPYANVHIINRRISGSTRPNGDEVSGFAANLGLRFVTLGGSINYSYWNTTDQSRPEPVKLTMHSLDVAGALIAKRLILNIAAVSFEREDPLESFRKGGVITVDTKFRLWRENYATAEVARANTSETGEPGTALQTKLGFRSFILPGVEVMVQHTSEQHKHEDISTDTVTSSKRSYISTQLHTYF